MSFFTRLALLAAIVTALTFTAAGQTCSFSVSPANQSVFANGGNFTINITASSSSCSRTVTTNTPWITISFGQTGTGSGTAGYTVQANNTNSQRSGTINVAGIVFTVTQAAGTCTYTLTPSSANFTQEGGTGSFAVSSGCTWTASSNAGWIQVTGAGDGTVGYSVEPYTGGTDRTGTITVGTSTFTVRQSAACVFTAQHVNAAAIGGTYSIQVQGRDGCTRTATSANLDWITITSGATGDGSGTIGITVAANQTRAQRIGSILLNGSPFVQVIQSASTCLIQLNPRTASVPVNGGNLSFAVTANCAWTATTTTPWIVILTGASGSGSGSVTYSVARNLDANTRSGIISVNGEQFLISQAGESCDVYLTQSSATVPAEGESGVIRVSSLAGCTWTASTADDWIRLSKSGGVGTEDVSFTVSANPTNRERRGTILLGGKPYEVRQLPARCTLAIERATIQIPASGARAELGVTGNCSWTATSNVGWIQVTGTAASMVTYSVSPNDGADERTGVITVAQTDPPERYTLTITQSGQRCSVTVSNNTASLPARGGSGLINVTGGSACNWNAVSSTDWLRVEWSSVSGSGNVRFFADANTTGTDRSATIAVSGQAITVQQPALIVRLTQAGILNAASFSGSGVAPGEVITIYGMGFGPTALTTLQLTPNGQAVTNTLGDTRVLFDGEPSPMVYALEGQLGAIVPYGVATKQAVGVQVEYLGVRSNIISVPVVAAAPGIFTTAATGRGQAAVLNQDFTVNAASNAAARNSIVQIFATGEGQTRPAGIDGQLAVAPLSSPVLPVQVFIGGVEATVTYAGAAPGLVAGVMQVNARVPQDVQPGAEVPVVIRVGTFESPAGPTIAVR